MNNITPRLQMFVIPAAKKQEESKDKDVENKMKPLAPLYLLLKILSLDPTETNKWIRLIRGISMLVLLIGSIVWSLWMRFNYAYVGKSKVVATADLIGFIIICSLSIFNVIFSFTTNSVIWNNSINNFKIVDSLLGITKPWLSYVLKKTVVRLIIILGIIIIYLGSFDFYTWTTTYDYYHSFSLIINYAVYTMNASVIVHFVILVYFTWSRFFILNSQLKAYFQLESKDNQTEDPFRYFMRSHKHSFLENLFLNSTSFQRLGEQAAKKKIFNVDSFVKIYLILCNQTDLFNYNFYIQNLLVTLSGLFTLLRSLRIMAYFVIDELEKPNIHITPVITSINFALYDIAILLLITSVCVLTTSEAKETAIILDIIIYNQCRGEEREKLEAWSKLMIRRFPYFSACTLFPLDYTLLYNLTGTVVTYSIIIIQMK